MRLEFWRRLERAKLGQLVGSSTSWPKVGPFSLLFGPLLSSNLPSRVCCCHLPPTTNKVLHNRELNSAAGLDFIWPCARALEETHFRAQFCAVLVHQSSKCGQSTFVVIALGATLKLLVKRPRHSRNLLIDASATKSSPGRRSISALAARQVNVFSLRHYCNF